MLSFLKNLFILMLCSSITQVQALSSASYLIANKAIDNYDFERAYTHFDKLDIILNETYLYERLLTYTNLNYLNEAKNISKEIIKINESNQEAWIIYLIEAKINGNSNAFEEFNLIKSKYEMELLNFIFFTKNGDLNENIIISQSIFEIIKVTLSENQKNTNYSFLLFYLSVASIVDPNFLEPYYYKAQVYQFLKKYSKSQFFYNKIPTNHYLFLDSQINISLNKIKLGFFNEGEKNLLRLIRIYKNNINLFITLADTYRIEKKYKKAISYYSKIIKLSDINFDQYWKIFYLRGICYERLNNWKLAEKDFLYSLELKNDSPQVLNYLAYGWLEREINLDLAITMLNKAYKQNPNSYYILDSLAWAYFKLNKYEKALQLMEEVIVMAPGEIISLDHLADIYYAMDRKREAVYYWKQALDLSRPEDLINNNLNIKITKYNEE